MVGGVATICTCAQSQHHSGLRLSHGVSLGLSRGVSHRCLQRPERPSRRPSSIQHGWPHLPLKRNARMAKRGEGARGRVHIVSIRSCASLARINACVQEKGRVAAAQEQAGVHSAALHAQVLSKLPIVALTKRVGKGRWWRVRRDKHGQERRFARAVQIAALGSVAGPAAHHGHKIPFMACVCCLCIKFMSRGFVFFCRLDFECDKVFLLLFLSFFLKENSKSLVLIPSSELTDARTNTTGVAQTVLALTTSLRARVDQHHSC
jgi:hypothetical protein